MPSLSMYKISAPTDAKEFENLLLDYAERVYSGRATLLGRQGQTQHGIDVVVIRNDFSIVCVQCKNIKNKNLTRSNIDEWVLEAEKSPITMQLFVIAVAAERDAAIQEYVYQIMSSRIKEGKFPIEIVFWDDIEHFVKLNDDILRLYYPFLYQEIYKENNRVDKYPELIKNEEELRITFLNEFVKYQIEYFLKVDIFVGFPFKLATMCDEFEFEIQRVLSRAIGITKSELYDKIIQFMYALEQYNYCLVSIGELVNEYRVCVINLVIRNEHEKYETEINMLRGKVISLLDEIIS